MASAEPFPEEKRSRARGHACAFARSRGCQASARDLHSFTNTSDVLPRSRKVECTEARCDNRSIREIAAPDWPASPSPSGAEEAHQAGGSPTSLPPHGAGEVYPHGLSPLKTHPLITERTYG